MIFVYIYIYIYIYEVFVFFYFLETVAFSWEALFLRLVFFSYSLVCLHFRSWRSNLLITIDLKTRERVLQIFSIGTDLSLSWLLPWIYATWASQVLKKKILLSTILRLLAPKAWLYNGLLKCFLPHHEIILLFSFSHLLKTADFSSLFMYPFHAIIYIYLCIFLHIY